MVVTDDIFLTIHPHRNAGELNTTNYFAFYGIVGTTSQHIRDVAVAEKFDFAH
jgi:hypothetical protein